MADDKPRPKPGSLRDRIAAFEQKPAEQAPAPTPRLKPGHVQWKPRTSSPPASPPPGGSADAPSPERKYGGARGGMTAADAKESIGMGGSLKDRMAALQGRGAFAAPAPAPPPPKPAADRPKWKPPVQAQSPEHEHEHEVQDQEHAKAEVLEAEERASALSVTSPTAELAEGEAYHDDEGGEEPADADAEEEERKRRAAIAARMARLGGARFGMAAPMYAPKPQPKHRESVTSNESARSPSAADDPDKASLTEGAAEGGEESLQDTLSKHGAASSQVSLASLDSGSSAPARAKSPASMPAPTAPRRAGPPRRKAPKSPDSQLPALPTVDATVAQVEGGGGREEQSTPLDFSPRDEAKLDIEPGAEHEQEHEEEPEPPADESEEEMAARRKRIAERLAKSGGFNPFSPRPPTPPEEEADVTEAAVEGEVSAEAEIAHESEEEAPPAVEEAEDATEAAHAGHQDLAEPEEEDDHHAHGQDAAEPDVGEAQDTHAGVAADNADVDNKTKEVSSKPKVAHKDIEDAEGDGAHDK